MTAQLHARPTHSASPVRVMDGNRHIGQTHDREVPLCPDPNTPGFSRGFVATAVSPFDLLVTPSKTSVAPFTL